MEEKLLDQKLHEEDFNSDVIPTETVEDIPTEVVTDDENFDLKKGLLVGGAILGGAALLGVVAKKAINKVKNKDKNEEEKSEYVKLSWKERLTGKKIKEEEE